jgi:hypothetical protein
LRRLAARTAGFRWSLRGALTERLGSPAAEHVREACRMREDDPRASAQCPRGADLVRGVIADPRTVEDAACCTERTPPTRLPA